MYEKFLANGKLSSSESIHDMKSFPHIRFEQNNAITSCGTTYWKYPSEQQFQ